MLRYDGDNFEEDVVPSEDKDHDLVPTTLDQDFRKCPSRINRIANLNQYQHIPANSLVHFGINILVLNTVQHLKFNVFRLETINLMCSKIEYILTTLNGAGAEAAECSPQ